MGQHLVLKLSTLRFWSTAEKAPFGNVYQTSVVSPLRIRESTGVIILSTETPCRALRHGAGNFQPVSVMRSSSEAERAGMAVQALRFYRPPQSRRFGQHASRRLWRTGPVPRAVHDPYRRPGQKNPRRAAAACAVSLRGLTRSFYTVRSQRGSLESGHKGRDADISWATWPSCWATYRRCASLMGSASSATSWCGSEGCFRPVIRIDASMPSKRASNC